MDKRARESKKFIAFLVTDFVLMSTLILATILKAPIELSAYVISGVVVSGLGIIFGQAGIDAIKAYGDVKKKD